MAGTQAFVDVKLRKGPSCPLDVPGPLRQDSPLLPEPAPGEQLRRPCRGLDPWRVGCAGAAVPAGFAL
eukprot:226986-Alexandrium_andersonii.AAC.1